MYNFPYSSILMAPFFIFYFLDSGKEIKFQKGNLAEAPLSVLQWLDFKHDVVWYNTGYEKTAVLFIFLQ